MSVWGEPFLISVFWSGGAEKQGKRTQCHAIWNIPVFVVKFLFIFRERGKDGESERNIV